MAVRLAKTFKGANVQERGVISMTATHYAFRCRKGLAEIIWRFERGQTAWHCYFNGEWIGGYGSPRVSAEQIAGGSCNWPSEGDISEFGISDDLSDWAVR